MDPPVGSADSSVENQLRFFTALETAQIGTDRTEFQAGTDPTGTSQGTDTVQEWCRAGCSLCLPWTPERAESWTRRKRELLRAVEEAKDRAERDIAAKRERSREGRRERQDLYKWTKNIRIHEAWAERRWNLWRNQPYWDTKTIYLDGVPQ